MIRPQTVAFCLLDRFDTYFHGLWAMRVTQGARAAAVAVLGADTMSMTDCDTLVAGDSAGMLHLGHEP